MGSRCKGRHREYIKHAGNKRQKISVKEPFSSGSVTKKQKSFTRRRGGGVRLKGPRGKNTQG